MPFCRECGYKMTDEATVCLVCGWKTGEEIRSKRQEEWAGKIIKCPSCGARLTSYTAICPDCGHELNSTRISDSLSLFIKEINECDQKISCSKEENGTGWSKWEPWQKVGWVLLNIITLAIPLLIINLIGKPSLIKEEKIKASKINNYTFPNNRGAILEALSFIESKVIFLSKEKISANSHYWLNLWTTKADQLYKNAEVLFPNDAIANERYNNIKRINKEFNKKNRKRKTIIIICIVLILSYVIGSGLEKERKTQELYSQVEALINDGNLDEARNKTDLIEDEDIRKKYLYMISEKDSSKGTMIQIGISPKEAKKKDYKEVEKMFEAKGFGNVVSIPQRDIKLGILAHDGEIESITIDGSKKWSADDSFPPNAEIIITYHTYDK